MKAKVTIALILVGAAVAATISLVGPSNQPKPEPMTIDSASRPPDPLPEPAISESAPASQTTPVAETEPPRVPEPAGQPAVSTNKLERLAKIRESFRALAAGDHATAMRAAKEITDETERETALLTLVTEWTHGELSSPRRRAALVNFYGLEAGLGFELAKDPGLARLWANELTEGGGRVDLLQQVAGGMVGSDPTAAFALSQQVPETERRKFLDAIFADWAGKDTDAAMQWAGQLPDPAERDAAVEAIHSVAPVGIGAALAVQDGYPIVNVLVPGTPAALSGQINPGDRIVGLAQGNNQFVDAYNVSLEEIVKMVRGTSGTLLQLRVLPADAPADSTPRSVSIIRDQIKFKR